MGGDHGEVVVTMDPMFLRGITGITNVFGCQGLWENQRKMVW